MADYELGIQVMMDAGEVKDALETINSELNNLPGSVEVDISVNDLASSILNDIGEMVEELPSEVEITISGDAGDLPSTLESIKDGLEGLQENVTIDFNADDNVTSTLREIIESYESLHDVNIEATVEDNATEVLKEIRDLIEEIPSSVEIVVDAVGDAEAQLSQIKDMIGDVDGSSASVSLEVEGAEEATASTDNFGLSLKSVGKTAMDAGSAVVAYDLLIKGLDYKRAIRLAEVYTGATKEQVKQMQRLVEENMSVRLGMAGTAQVMALLAKYTGNATEAMAYFPTVMDAIKVTGEDATTTTLGLMNTFRNFNVTAEESHRVMSRLFQLYNISGFQSFQQFLNVVNRTGLTLKQLGFTAEETAGLVAAVGPQGMLVMRGFANQLYALNSEWESGSEKAKEYMEKLEKIGIATHDATGKVRPLKDVIYDFIEYLRSLPTHEERVAAANSVFGDKMGKALVAIAEGYGKVEESSKTSAEQQVKDTKKVMKETLTPMDQFKKTLEKYVPFAAEIGGAISWIVGAFADLSFQLWATLRLVDWIDKHFFGEAFLRKTNEWSQRFASWIREKIPSNARQGLKEGLSRVGSSIRGFIDDLLKKTLDGFRGIGERILKFLRDEFGRIKPPRISLPELKPPEIKLPKPDTSKLKGWVDDFVKNFKRFLDDELGEVVVRATPKVEFKWPEFKLPKGWGPGKDAIDDAARSFMNRFVSSSDDAARVSIPKLGSRIGSLLVRGIGEGAGAALMTVDILANARQYLQDILTDPAQLFGPIAYTTPEPVRRIFSPENLLKRLYGPEEWEKRKGILMDNTKKYVEDPIREQLRKFAENPPGYLIQGFSQMWNDFKSWVSSHIPKFRWPRLPSLSIPNPVTAIQSAWAKFREWVSSHIPRFRWPRLPNITIPNIVGAVQLAWSKFKSWVSSNIPRFRWPRLPNVSMPDIVGAFRRTWSTFTSKVRGVFSGFKWPRFPSPSFPNFTGIMRSVWSSFTRWVSDRFRGFKWPKLPLPDFSGIAAQFRSWGSRFISNLAAGIRSAIPNLNSVLSIIRRLLPSSPPKEGPLSTLTYEIMHEYGYLLGTHFNRGLSATIPGTVESLGKPSLVMPSDVTAGRGGSMLMSGLNLQINTNVSVDKIESEVDVDGMARRITDKVKDTMREELNRQGIPSYLYGRGYVTGVR